MTTQQQLPTQIQTALQQPSNETPSDNGAVLSEAYNLNAVPTEQDSSSGVLQPNQPVQLVEPDVKGDSNPGLSAEELTQLGDLMQRQFGVSVEEASQLAQSYKTNPEEFGRQNAVSSLSTDWGISVADTEERLKTLSQLYAEVDFVKDDPEQWGSPEGVKRLWQIHEINQPKSTPPTIDKPSNLLTTAPRQAAYQFTQKQIDAMSPNERRKNHSAIVKAYANNQVLR